MNSKDVVIVGGGQAAAQLAASIREEGFHERIRIICSESVTPYQRPPLSKKYLAGSIKPGSLLLKSNDFYDKHNIDLILGDGVQEIGRVNKRVVTRSGHTMSYGHLVLATGSTNRQLPIENSAQDSVLYLRTLGEAEAIKSRLVKTKRVIVIGCGFVGLELAATLHELGHEVIAIEAAQSPLQRSVTPAIALHLVQHHQAAGIEFLFGAQITRIRKHESWLEIDVEGRGVFRADLVLVGIGAKPETRLAAKSGLLVSSGIEVNEFLATQDESISAIGDCCTVCSPLSSQGTHVEAVSNAIDQARTLARTLSGRKTKFAAVPWFWSDQGNQKLQIAGISHGYDNVVIRGNIESGSFSVFCFRGKDLVAVESLNRPLDHVCGRRLLETKRKIDKQQIASPEFDLKSFALKSN